jgi:hypothetical protein
MHLGTVIAASVTLFHLGSIILEIRTQNNLLIHHGNYFVNSSNRAYKDKQLANSNEIKKKKRRKR